MVQASATPFLSEQQKFGFNINKFDRDPSLNFHFSTSFLYKAGSWKLFMISYLVAHKYSLNRPMRFSSFRNTPFKQKTSFSFYSELC
jgi:hypothetical protein